MSTELERPRWYSIKEAAEYLDVGEPTLYRWMKDGQITYRKVGDSTRFCLEDLEGAVQVFHSKRTVEKVQQSCPYCNHTELLDGRLQTSGLVYFRPTKTKFWTFKDGNVNVRSLMCTRCGGLFCIGDVAKLNSLKVTEEEPEAKGKPSAVEAK